MANLGDLQAYGQIILPVRFKSFEIMRPDCSTARLLWKTAGETNNKSFEVQRSVDGKEWQNIGFVKGKGNTLVAQMYSFNYEHLALGINFFRIKQIDNDDNLEYSPIIRLYNCKTITSITLYPNPANENIIVQVNNSLLVGSKATLLYPHGGKVKSIILADKQSIIQLAGLLPGTYILITADNKTYKIIKQ